ncbi:TadE/TadG family type IV pilus assembly protein [Thetidibacter halocola]|uniref:Pilus assembly protein n=1 Tax=Thetidibacter halocola TaxID=2827239 RepID=A0A8J8B8A9_9RHOB|nr:TadE/TadG family type IV pilus assembly protein [Thetidibacter halocola]MBS0125312.1 pilus assembly protein [Thetidibacter halocola]
MFAKFSNLLRRFRRDQSGNVTIETVIWVPLLILILGATFSFYEAFRQKSLNTKAAFTISDALSRETDPIDDEYLDGMLSLLEFLTDSSGPYSMRVTMVRFSDDDGYLIDWTQARGGFDTLDDATLASMEENLPKLLNNESVIVVETQTEYTPTFEVESLQPQNFYNFVFTRPRFAPKLVWKESTPAA